MEEIEVGEYVRTKRGEICKVLGINPELKNGRVYSYKSYILDNRKGSLTKTYILKHSKNIIELIEEGDIIVVYLPIKKLEMKVIVDKYFCDSLILKGIKGKTIILKSIITKEQFESDKYRIEKKWRKIMNEIKVGEYIRTDNGIIAILKEIEERKNETLYVFYYKDKTLVFPKQFIVNHSEDIIELIELGDYVNGKKVTAILINGRGADFRAIQADTEIIYNNFIKTIVTKEQFKSVEYRMEG